MAGLSFENGLRLHFDSILLFENKAYPSAYFLCVLAIEEIGARCDTSRIDDDVRRFTAVEGHRVGVVIHVGAGIVA